MRPSGTSLSVSPTVPSPVNDVEEGAEKGQALDLALADLSVSEPNGPRPALGR
jgi:hypothetical protein